jgi:epoxyqueuosine reductase
MIENTIIKRFHEILNSEGYKGQVVSANHIPELRNDIKKHHEKKLFSSKFYEEYKSFFEFEPEVDFEQIKSLFVIATPVPQFKSSFQWNGKKISLFIPPTYLYGLKIFNQAQKILNNILKPAGYNLAYARLPVKTLAVRSGLAEYGRNNITYVSDMGSFHRLSAFYSDFSVEQDMWQELKMMDMCTTCSACTQKCPTGAIPKDRFLLRVEKCLTYHNEQPKEVPFPDWIDSQWHNCLVGCLHCQKVCPANKKVKDWIEPGPEFNEGETRQILEGKKFKKLPPELKKKIKKFDLVNYYEILPRNLSVFLN